MLSEGERKRFDRHRRLEAGSIQRMAAAAKTSTQAAVSPSEIPGTYGHELAKVMTTACKTDVVPLLACVEFHKGKPGTCQTQHRLLTLCFKEQVKLFHGHCRLWSERLVKCAEDHALSGSSEAPPCSEDFKDLSECMLADNKSDTVKRIEKAKRLSNAQV